MRRVLLRTLGVALILYGAAELGQAAYSWRLSGGGVPPVWWCNRLLELMAIVGGIRLLQLRRGGCLIIVIWAFANLGLMVYFFLSSVYTGYPFDFNDPDILYFHGLFIGLIGLLFIVIILFLTQKETRRLCR